MKPEAKKDVLAVLQDALTAIKNGRYADLHAISDHVLHVIAIYQYPDVIDIATAIYALDKTLETEKYSTHPKMKLFLKDVLYSLKDAIRALEEDDIEKYTYETANLLAAIQGFTKKVKLYTEDILHFSKIKKGSKLYEHGLSLGRAAETMGITKWELMGTTGETAVHEKYVEPIAIDEKRMNFIWKLFRVK
jgi:hypothetical protein